MVGRSLLVIIWGCSPTPTPASANSAPTTTTATSTPSPRSVNTSASSKHSATASPSNPPLDSPVRTQATSGYVHFRISVSRTRLPIKHLQLDQIVADYKPCSAEGMYSCNSYLPGDRDTELRVLQPAAADGVLGGEPVQQFMGGAVAVRWTSNQRRRAARNLGDRTSQDVDVVPGEIAAGVSRT